MQIGVIGLGRMGGNMSRRLLKAGHQCVVFDADTGMHPSSRHRPIIVAVILLVAVLVGVTGYLEKWLWMRQLDYTGIFWTLVSVPWVMFCSAFVVEDHPMNTIKSIQCCWRRRGIR